MRYLILVTLVVSIASLNAQTIDFVAIKQVDSLIKISREFTGKGDFDNALQLNAAAEKIALEKTGKKSASYGSCTFNRGRVNAIKGNYPEAEKWYLESKEIREKTLGREHPDYAWSLNNLAILYQNTGEYGKSESLHQEAMLVREKVLGKEHSDYAGSLRNLASLYRIIGKYEKAEPLLMESVAIQKKIKSNDQSEYAQSLNSLGILYLDMGYYEKAEPLYLESQTIWEKVKGKGHPIYAVCLNNLANLYDIMGYPKKAEPLFLEAKAIQEKELGREHPNYASILNNLASFYAVMGNYEKAETLYLESTDILEHSLGMEHPDYAQSLNNLGGLYFNIGNYEKAELMYLTATVIWGKAKGKENPDYALSLNNLAAIYQVTGNNEKAELLNLEAKAIWEKIVGTEHPDYAISLNSISTVYYQMSNFEKAELFMLEHKVLVEKILGKKHPNYSESLHQLAQLYERLNRFSAADPLIKEAFLCTQDRLVQATSFLSEIELSKYVSTFQNAESNLTSFLLARSKNGNQEGILPALVFDQQLFRKGFLLTAALRLNSSLIHSTEATEIMLGLKAFRRRLAAEYAKPLNEREAVDELESNANSFEKKLARSFVGYEDETRQVKWQDVQVALKPAIAAIEFVSFKITFPKKTDSIFYAALLLKTGQLQPQFISLFEEKSLDSLLHSNSERKADYVNSLYTLADRGAVAIEAPKKSLYELIWKPLEKDLVGIKTIYFSPSGLLHRINLDAIPVSETETLADQYNLIALNSTRQLVIPTQIKIVNNDAIVYGGILYEQDSILEVKEALFATRTRGSLTFSSVDSTLRAGTWNYLTGTEREVNAIEKLMLTAGVKVNLKIGYNATEESFKNIGTNNTASPKILHIATHGYIFQDPKTSNKTGIDQSESAFKISDHPMLRSGLIMAGGNAAWQGKQTLEGKEDGILTAYEISQMNLSNTELVVLSACETGLGDIQGNEGVYGLQRAFKIAGAKYLIMSLWQVPDKQTSLLMTTFYKKWLENKMSIPDAFHAAQKELRDIGLDPYQWAGFVLVE